MARQLRLSLGRQSLPSFDDFVRGPSNTEAFEAVRRWPNWPGGCLTLVGPKGAGKTHLAKAWAETAGAVTIDRAAPDLTSAMGRHVLIEDADQGLPSESLFHLINLAGREGGGLLLTARTLPASWPTALPDLRSRLNALPVAEISPPDDQVLEGVLRRFFRERNIRPPEAVYPYLLARMSRSIPDAEEIVRRLDEAGDEGFRPVTRVLARQILEAGLPLD
ncbi:DnaA ATPase domain-containing protein [Phenylobacterium kunshanense]|uniref:Chromosomal replication initiator DnaA n=1 Tax=Phenylobacterium kunshanense TaxID=1445034 RepID=A0A328BQ96_9CAUL|nr:DnaA/Hda family protein [Phenylobacterium kunshanense]RAK68671.1 chromosomal replication initiator DnaA [Phenylobacterium kunshanense]